MDSKSPYESSDSNILDKKDYTNFLSKEKNCSLRKTVLSSEKMYMSADKYPSIFPRQMEAIIYNP